MAQSSPVHSSDSNFERDVLQAEVPVLVDFWASWCGPCRAVAPHLETLAQQFAGRAKVVKIDVDSNPETPGQYGVRGIPTLVLFNKGEVAGRLVGNPGRLEPLVDLVEGAL